MYWHWPQQLSTYCIQASPSVQTIRIISHYIKPDLYKAFDIVDQNIVLSKLLSVGVNLSTLTLSPKMYVPMQLNSKLIYTFVANVIM